MKINSSSKNNFSNIEIQIKQDDMVVKLDMKKPFRDKKKGLQKKPFDFKLTLDGEEYTGE